MKKTTFSEYRIDNASILFLSLMRKNHTNTYRFSMTLTEPVCPETLQLAVDRIYRRFPTVIAGFYPGFFHYFQIPAKEPPLVKPDPGCLLTMSKEEIRTCSYRVYYKDNTISIEVFHALTDGHGAIASFTTLVAEYLRILHGIPIPSVNTLLDIEQSPMLMELEDSFLEHEDGKPMHLPSRYAYQLPAHPPVSTGIHRSHNAIVTSQLLAASRRYGVSMTTLLSTVMAQSVMEIQQRHAGSNRLKPVRIMVPVDLRKMFPSRTLRNFVLYALPTLEPQDHYKPLSDLLHSFREQMQEQIQKKRMASIMAYNVRMQENWLFRHIPRFIKCACLRFGYQFFGESNSSVTVTNLGNLQLPEEMRSYIETVEVILTPRISSPYGCALISYNGFVHINISRFSKNPELEEVFFQKLNSIL